jgi:hypothetical protein
MKYALGNMLNGAGSLNPDGLSLDLQFAADKTLTARKGPTPVFTRASTATFVGSDGLIQSAAVNAPRFDHDPLTLACKGLLIEEGRTNSITDSNAFNTWTTTGVSVAASSVSTPEGTADAWKVVEDSLLSIHTATRAFTAVSGITYTASVWLKAAENGFAFLGLVGNAFSTFTLISVDLSTGAVTTATGTPFGATSVAYSNGWWRVSISQTATSSTSSNIDIRLSRDGVFANRSYLGNGVNGMYVYGAQVEAGSFPTSYIPTTTAALARSADVCSITGSDFSGFYNPLEGSLFTSAIFNAPAAYGTGQILIDINDTTAANRLRYFRNPTSGTAGFANTSAGSLNVVFTGVSTLQSFVAQKYSAGFKLNDYAFYVNNSQVGTDNLGAMLVSPTTMTIGNSSAAIASQYTNGHIAQIRYFRKRLSNQKLQTLTT